jgi:hypothetical protein
MTLASPPESTVRWKSLSGIGLGLILLYGVVNAFAAIAVPMMLEANGGQGGGGGGVIFARGPEEFMLGTTYVQLRRDNPRLDQLLVDTMVGMCSMMMSMAIAFLGVAWFAARRRARWAPWVLLVSAFSWVPYYFIIASDMRGFGASDTFMAAVMVAIFAIPPVLGAALMLADQRRRSTPAQP